MSGARRAALDGALARAPEPPPRVVGWIAPAADGGGVRAGLAVAL